GAIIGL
nr:Chain A, Amyloid beta A4 protein [Homo sapiens]3PZZ_B Chain B, Amyloid beta A4 protein [Homo sapiens]